ncbi:MAG TPA: START domain-containing protein [Polyangia bacterium]
MLRLLALALPLLAADVRGYKHVGGRNGIEVFRNMASSVIDLYAEGDFAAPPQLVREVLLDYDIAPKITDNVAESRVLVRNDHEVVTYQRLKLPVISDRDFTVRATWGHRGQALTMQFAVDNSRGPEPHEGIVRMSLLQGTWLLEPRQDGAATHARYHVQIDLAGDVPRWMVSGGAAKNLPKVFEGVRREAAVRMAGTPMAGRNRVVR